MAADDLNGQYLQGSTFIIVHSAKAHRKNEGVDP